MQPVILGRQRAIAIVSLLTCSTHCGPDSTDVTTGQATSEQTSTATTESPPTEVTVATTDRVECGDGLVSPGEACDDGNGTDDDGCDTDCLQSKVIDAAAGSRHTCVVSRVGNLYCWGGGESGQLGLGDIEDRGVGENPAEIPAVDTGIDVRAVHAGGGNTCIVTIDDTVKCWGFDANGILGQPGSGQLGDDEVPADISPIDLGGPVDHMDLSGARHACAVLKDRSLRCWGRNADGRLGLGHTMDIGDDELPLSSGPVNVGSKVIQISVQGGRSCALLDRGRVRCWGTPVGGNGYGGFEVFGDDEPPSEAGDILLGKPAVQIEVGGVHVCALLADQTVSCWGQNSEGNLGYGHTDDVGDDEQPGDLGPVPLPKGATSVFLGVGNACAVLVGGAIACWGRGSMGILGYGDTENVGDNETPEEKGLVNVGSLVEWMTLGPEHTCAITETRAFRCWGSGHQGKTGYGNEAVIGDDEPPAAVGEVVIF